MRIKIDSCDELRMELYRNLYGKLGMELYGELYRGSL
jgi:hypothetical protein